MLGDSSRSPSPVLPGAWPSSPQSTPLVEFADNRDSVDQVKRLSHLEQEKYFVANSGEYSPIPISATSKVHGAIQNKLTTFNSIPTVLSSLSVCGVHDHIHISHESDQQTICDDGTVSASVSPSKPSFPTCLDNPLHCIQHPSCQSAPNFLSLDPVNMADTSLQLVIPLQPSPSYSFASRGNCSGSLGPTVEEIIETSSPDSHQTSQHPISQEVSLSSWQDIDSFHTQSIDLDFHALPSFSPQFSLMGLGTFDTTNNNLSDPLDLSNFPHFLHQPDGNNAWTLSLSPPLASPSTSSSTSLSLSLSLHVTDEEGDTCSNIPSPCLSERLEPHLENMTMTTDVAAAKTLPETVTTPSYMVLDDKSGQPARTVRVIQKIMKFGNRIKRYAIQRIKTKEGTNRPNHMDPLTLVVDITTTREPKAPSLPSRQLEHLGHKEALRNILAPADPTIKCTQNHSSSISHDTAIQSNANDTSYSILNESSLHVSLEPLSCADATVEALNRVEIKVTETSSAVSYEIHARPKTLAEIKSKRRLSLPILTKSRRSDPPSPGASVVTISHSQSNPCSKMRIPYLRQTNSESSETCSGPAQSNHGFIPGPSTCARRQSGVLKKGQWFSALSTLGKNTKKNTLG